MTGQTVPFGFPYPQCDPPLTKDGSDIADLRDLAIAVDTRMEAMAVQADDLLVSPDAATLVATGSQVLSTPTDQLTMATVEYDTSASGDLAQGAQSRFVVQQTGVYLLTCSIRPTFSALYRVAISVDVNGMITGPFGQAALNNVEGGVGLLTVKPLNEGDIVLFRWAGSAVAATINSARGGIWRMI